ncbi:trigger factor [Bradymonas sediminis]|uniref:Trigger factor n=1 Tax=Bradymonas sediminis TaxID=1548548 RepID=A0A2Z4FN09_9DELT|nr:trigger factor [Bradymonas sediminis]AWV90230.1 trigger factor [Bradymonas sediminis]TDP75801.1 trigger factor [Bradymonas sediminis]
MPYEVEETGNLTRLVTVTVPAEERKKRVNKELRKIAKTAKIRGFRKGAVPFGEVKKRYGAEVDRDTIEGLVRDYLNKIVEESEQVVLHLGRPEFGDAAAVAEGDVTFTVDLEVRQDVDPVGYLGLELKKEKIEVTSEKVDERLEQLRERYATLEPISGRKKIAEGDVVTFDYEAQGAEENEELANFKGKGGQVEIGGKGGSIPGLEEGLTGLAFDATKVIEVTPNENFGIASLVGEAISLEVTVTEVKHKVLPELDDDFAKDTGQAETLDELREKLSEEIEKGLEHDAMHSLQSQVLEKLIEQNEIELPPKFVQEQLDNERNQRLRALQQAIQQGMNPASLGIDLETYADPEAFRPDVEKGICVDFLLTAIFEKEELKLEEADLMATIEHQAMHQRVQPQQLLQQLLQDQNGMAQIQHMAMLEKTRIFLVEKGEIEEVPAGSLSEEAEEKPKAKAKSKAKPKAKAKSKSKTTKKKADKDAEEKPKAKAKSKSKTTKKKADKDAEEKPKAKAKSKSKTTKAKAEKKETKPKAKAKSKSKATTTKKKADKE